MSELHPSQADFEAYVRDALDARGVNALEAHVARCQACTAQLQATARLELQLAEVAQTAPHPDWRPFARLVPALAVGAAMAVLLLLPKPAGRPVLDDGEAWAPDAPPGVEETLSVEFDISEVGRRTLPRYERMTPAHGGFYERGVALR
jgi:anti-sigma factor RsiW